MFFYVDESGHTGANLFDKSQPILYYGVLSSKINLDEIAESKVKTIRKKLGVERLHAAELGNGRLAGIVKDVDAIRKRYDLRFDIYRVAKADHALISFFDQVFDQGMNPAVPWTSYWTPLRYVLLIRLAALFDEDLLREAWSARISLKTERANESLSSICLELKKRSVALPDERSRQVIGDALSWAADNPNKICYNVESKNDLLQITPNLIGFQAVMHGISSRLIKSGKTASKIIVDKQSQFNRSQRKLSDFYASNRNAPIANGIGLPEIDFRGMPEIPISCTAGTDSTGLELVDIYLWVFKRFMEKKELAPELFTLIKSQRHRGYTDEISIHAISSRWGKWFEELPEPTSDQIKRGREMKRISEIHRLKAMNNA
ncbi:MULTISPECIES: DUF3800 domain-containing protein [unclassified Cobetia]|uniref:DUF3800 domain-containing protein n=1 Tax=unclassified Cobetia TaxID=2609414 RepID=UPI002097C2C5|nr:MULTISPECIES: DUF3800 domain-containing protein [unclassified Cobetia]MCO7231759.1 DUF3800 domain-containing protein [Cobetia sp. Dlab-2-AX]MCO7234925.1 DUF3800 domain-containing protein [Cobetia sp. Dlab-2-U]